jgi:predicted peroxiredoxin
MARQGGEFGQSVFQHLALFEPNQKHFPSGPVHKGPTGFYKVRKSLSWKRHWTFKARLILFLKKKGECEMEEKKVPLESEEGKGKRDFLKMMGTGLGVAGVGAMMGVQAFAADAEKKGKYVIVITHGGNDPNRAIFGLLMAQTVADKEWGKVYVWMTLDGADLVNKKKTERIDSPIYKKFGNAAEIMKKIKDKGGWFGVCPPCAEYFGATGSDKYDWVDLAGGDWLMKNMQDAWVLWI